MAKKSIIIDLKAHNELTKLTESLNMNYGSLVEEMIYYFKKTGIDPKDAVNKNPSVMVATLDKRIVSFMKVQERDILIPLRKEVNDYQNLQKEETTKLINSINRFLNHHKLELEEFRKNHSNEIQKITKKDDEKMKLLNIELNKQRNAIIKICELIDDKNKSGTIDKIKSIFS